MSRRFSGRRRPPGGTAVLAAALVLLALVVPGGTTAFGAALDEENGHVGGAGPHSGAEPGEHDEAHGGGHGGDHGPGLGSVLPLWSVIPFVGILLSIAIFPLAAPHFWHHHFPKVSAAWALIFAVPFVIGYGSAAVHDILHIYFIDYIPFIILLWALFTISGGIRVAGTLKGTPAVNTLLLFIGTAIASWVGTTGAAMLLIRPLLRANEDRRRKVHTVVFFIFLVANIGGSLTPLGDPPLFLGFLHGVPFFWTLKLFVPMSFVSGILLAVYFVMDTYHFKREERPRVGAASNGSAGTPAGDPLRVEGLHNLLFLGGVMSGVILSGFWQAGTYNVLGIEMALQNSMRDLILILMGVLSLVTTPRRIREANQFTWFPIKEVAYLFAGIFMTIVPALAILKAGTEGALASMIEAITAPAHYFWVVGSLSSFLDNAPTYLTFLNSALGQFYPGVEEVTSVKRLLAEKEIFLMAISTGAVFMGANTYIGNAPNFMVKSIAEEAGVPMPSFFGYMIRYSLVILVPLFVLVNWIFY